MSIKFSSTIRTMFFFFFAYTGKKKLTDGQSSVVYRASCGLCYATYIGVTVRRLRDRVREHMRAAEKGDNASVLGKHYNSQHPRERPKISFEIVARC